MKVLLVVQPPEVKFPKKEEQLKTYFKSVARGYSPIIFVIDNKGNFLMLVINKYKASGNLFILWYVQY